MLVVVQNWRIELNGCPLMASVAGALNGYNWVELPRHFIGGRAR